MDIVETLQAAGNTPRTDETAVADRQVLHDAADELARLHEESRHLIAQFPPSKRRTLIERLHSPSDGDSVQDLMKQAAGSIRVGRDQNVLLRDRFLRGLSAGAIIELGGEIERLRAKAGGAAPAT